MQGIRDRVPNWNNSWVLHLTALSSDDFNVYNGYPVKAQQKCLAHLRRHFKKVVKLGHGNNQVLGQAFLDLIDEAFAQHRQWRETRSCDRLPNLGDRVQVTDNQDYRAMDWPCRIRGG